MSHINNKLFLKKSKINHHITTNIFALFLSAMIFAMILFLLINPAKYALSVTSGFMLFANAVFPGLFPFLILTRILTELGAVEKVSRIFAKPMEKLFDCPSIAAYVFISSALCGYPMGAKLTADLVENKIINEIDAKKMMTFCSLSGPVFTIATVGAAMFANIKAGLCIYISHIISALLCGLIFSLANKLKHNKQTKQTPVIVKNGPEQSPVTMQHKALDEIISSSVYNAVSTILIVGAFVTIFFLLIDIIFASKIISPIIFATKKLFSLINLNPNLAEGFISGLIEMTRGIKMISTFGASIESLVLTTALISFGGLSISMQVLSLAKKAKIKPAAYIGCKLVHLIISLPITLIVAFLMQF